MHSEMMQPLTKTSPSTVTVERLTKTLLLLLVAQASGLAPPERIGLVPMTERPTAELWALLDAPQASTADNALEALAARGAATKWRSAELQPRYAVSTTQLETTTRCRGDIADAVGVLGG